MFCFSNSILRPFADEELPTDCFAAKRRLGLWNGKSMPLLDQFRSGECAVVWQRIVDERRRADDAEALAVAQETVLRARGNLGVVYGRLLEIGYDFAEPDLAFVTTTPDRAANEIAAIESRYGHLPGLARVWYSYIHSVNFAQTETQRKDSNSGLRNLGLCPLAIYLPLGMCHTWGSEIHGQYVEWYRRMQSDEMAHFDSVDDLNRCCKTPEESARFLPLGSFASNNENKGFTLPSDQMDEEFFNDGEAVYFNEDLRYVIMSGSFPRLRDRPWQEKLPAFMRLGHPDPDSLLAYLTQDLQPI